MISFVRNNVYSHQHILHDLFYNTFFLKSSHNSCQANQLRYLHSVPDRRQFFGLKRNGFKRVPGESFFSLHQDVSHGFDVLVSIIWIVASLVSTRVGVIRIPFCTKTDSGITAVAFILLVTKETDSCSGTVTVFTHSSHSIKPFLVTVALQGCL